MGHLWLTLGEFAQIVGAGPQPFLFPVLQVTSVYNLPSSPLLFPSFSFPFLPFYLSSLHQQTGVLFILVQILC